MTRRRIVRMAIFLAIAGAAFWIGAPHLPDRWIPWAPIRLSDAPNFLTGIKLRQLRDEPAICRAILERSDFAFTPIADQVTGPGCGFENAVRIRSADVSYGSGFVATCPLAVALALFERHALQPAAEAAFGQEIVAIDHLGSYACRNVGNRDTGRRSQHATANAIDIAGFRLRGGEQITVTQHWDGGGPKAEFLHDVRDGACRIFGAVLGPDYNDAHRTHLHLDLSFFSICR